MTWPPRRRHDEDGSVLVLALIVITVVALVVGAVLTQGSGSLKATVALRSVVGSSYAADGAAQIAINNLRSGQGFAANPHSAAFNNSLDGSGCFGQDASGNPVSTLSLDGFYPASGTQTSPTSALVECAGVKGTGMQGSPVPISSANKPGYAIVTLDGPLTTSDPLKVRGGVYSNASVDGPVTVDAGGVYASGGCAQAVATPKSCNTGAKIPDPGYASDLVGSTPPALQRPPTTCTSGVAVFEPGWYDNASTLTTATNLCSTAWFKPGTYYFDFRNDGCADVCPANLFGSAGNVWRINGKNVVGGTPIDASGATLALPSTSPSYPGACRSPITDQSAAGVQFVFGGSSRLYIDQNSHVELCGTYHANRPPIEIYGLKTGTTPAATTATGLGVTQVASAGGFTDATPTALEPGGTTASWVTGNSSNAQSTTLRARGFAPSSAVPPGAVLTAATLTVAHRDADATVSSRASATVTVGTATTAPLTVPASATGTTSSIPVTGADLNALQKAVHDAGYSGAEVAYTANARKANATTTLDSITLDLTYYLPTLRGQAGTCVATGTSCPLIDMKNGNNKILLYLQGTTYTPSAFLNVLLGNFSAEVAKFGVVARQLSFDITNGNPSWTGPIFEIPDNSPGYGYQNTTVDLKVHLCTNQPSGCTTSDPVVLTARVQLWDPGGSPVASKRQVTVLSWSEQR